jgi:hypothetical protein
MKGCLANFPSEHRKTPDPSNKIPGPGGSWSQPVYNSSGFLEFFIFLLPLSRARGRLRAEKKKRIKSHLFQIISHESGIQA